jgi:hypothetical protein
VPRRTLRNRLSKFRTNRAAAGRAAAANEAKRAAAAAKNELIFARLHEANYDTLPALKLITAKGVLTNYNKLHRFQKPNKNNNKIKKLRIAVKAREAANKAAANEAKRAAAAAKNEAIFSKIKNHYITNMNNNKLPDAKRILANYRKLHGFQRNSKNNQRIKNLREAIRLYETTQKAQKKIKSQSNSAVTLNAITSNTEFIKAYNKLGILGKRSLKTSNKERFDSRYTSAKGKKATENAFGAAAARAKKAAANEDKRAAATANNKALLKSLENFGNVTNNTISNARSKSNNYRRRYRFQPGFQNHPEFKALRNKIKDYETGKKAAANANEKERIKAIAKHLVGLTNNNPTFITEYNKLGMFGRRKFTPENKKQLNKKYTRIMKAAANKAAANKNAANKNAANKVAQRKSQINSQLNEYLTHVNAATIKQRIPVNLNKSFPGWRKVADKEKLRLLNAKLKPVPSAPVFNNAVLRKALQNHLSGVKRIYNKALINAILSHPNIKLTNNQRAELTKAKPAGGGFFSGLFDRKPSGPTGPPPFIPFKKNMKIPFGYVLKTNNNRGLGYYANNKALASQLEHRGYVPAPKPTSGSGGGGPNQYGYGNRYGNRYGYNRGGPAPKPTSGSGGGGPNQYGYGNRYGYNRGGPAPIAPSGGIVFAPKINVGAARIGAQTFGGTRVGGQQMGGSRVRTGNTGNTTLKTGNTGGTSVKTGNTGGARVNNAGRLAVSAPTSNGTRQLAATPEQLIRGAGGAEAIEKGIQALNAANGNVARAKAVSRLPNNTFTNIYALGGPVAAKKAVALRRRRRTTGGRRAPTKKRVTRKPKKQYIKLTPHQFRRLTDHIKKNNLRKVLIKEITR